ncbi:sugar phosphate isomerase/epimerase family protein [Halalkalibacter okhensis]|uniref:3-dehydroshikimate dehydratase n=1 Tax=Halalkalibacter okhensis TaxID=333138 RepID=A0A0B0IGU6_9BACI|nr:sugar phosphate isomerase/epimerase [Halalkalibacter okhensis]KHF40112.1 3-dehydroshikimate dehydratase [Halalkalibacter okhensis]
MKLSVCTISFRHHLHSIDQIAHWASTHHFQGIELWGIHAKNLADDPKYGENWLNSYELQTSMISDYLPLEGSVSQMMTETMNMSKLAKHWGTKKVRTFVGKIGSQEISLTKRKELVDRLRMICDFFESEGQLVLVETHPNTLTDNLASTIQLLEETNHPALRINFDVLHMWESGVCPIEAIRRLSPFVSHFHFKNISSREHLNVFAPENVYAAAGTRKGMTPLFTGAVNYQDFLDEIIPKMEVEASLEWFGPHVWDVLGNDSLELRKRMNEEHVLRT